ncbi:MAG: hypothetical protein ACLTWE_08095 [Dysgonomonas mossii]|uniref:hypothetical protein n=1 Tax=Dysgonomonas mossii TaxID=163665 RepID=UPI003993B4AD
MVKRNNGKANFRTCRLRKKYDYMNFSYEELYNMYGQYDKFLTIEFHINSEAYNLFGSSIMGTLKYTQEERDSLERVLKTKNIPRSDIRVKFIPSTLHELTEEQKIVLDRDGILCSDIRSTFTFNSPVNNLYNYTGKKELPPKIPIEVNMSNKEGIELMFGLYQRKLKDGYDLAPFETDEYYGMLAYFRSDKLNDKEKEEIYQDESDDMKPAVREHYLATKWQMGSLSDEEKEEIKSLWKDKFEHNRKVLEKEVERSTVKWSEIPLNKLMRLLAVAGSFNEEVLLIQRKPVWWDIERFLHIMVRHANDLQIGDYIRKTEFQYNYKDIRELIKNVLNSAEKDIEEEFKANPNRNYNRQGRRAVYYNGNYYKVEIEPSGRLLTFHPYNDDRERENDN